MSVRVTWAASVELVVIGMDGGGMGDWWSNRLGSVHRLWNGGVCDTDTTGREGICECR